METINVVNKTPEDFVTTYDITGGDTEFVFPVSLYGSLCIEIVAGEFDYPVGTTNGTDMAGTLDGTVDFYQSSDGINKQAVAGATTFDLNAAQKLGGWEEDVYEAAFGHIVIVQNSLTAGTVRILYTMKKGN